MKFRALLIIMLTFGYTAHAQTTTTYTKLSVEAGGGIFIASDSHADDYSQSTIGLPQVSLGGRYMFNENIGMRATLGYLNMKNAGDNSNEFNTKYYRGTLEGVADLKYLLRGWSRYSPWSVVLHAGGGVSRSDSKFDAADDSQETDKGKSDNTKSDNMIHLTGGAMAQYSISDRVSLYGDFSYFHHFSQGATWEGTTWEGITGDVNGGIGMVSVGIVYTLDTARIPWSRRIQRR